MWIGAVIDAIEMDHAEPDTWEAMHLTYAVQALVDGKHYAALTFSEIALMDPIARRPERLQPNGPKAVKLADLRRAAELLSLRKPPKQGK